MLDKICGFAVDEERKAQIEKLAELQGLNMSELMRKALDHFILWEANARNDNAKIKAQLARRLAKADSETRAELHADAPDFWPGTEEDTTAMVSDLIEEAITLNREAEKYLAIHKHLHY